MRVPSLTLIGLCLALVWPWPAKAGNPDAKRLYDDLLSNYNKLVRPVVNVSEAVTVRLKLKLSQLIDVVSTFPFTFNQNWATRRRFWAAAHSHPSCLFWDLKKENFARIKKKKSL